MELPDKGKQFGRKVTIKINKKKIKFKKSGNSKKRKKPQKSYEKNTLEERKRGDLKIWRKAREHYLNQSLTTHSTHSKRYRFERLKKIAIPLLNGMRSSDSDEKRAPNRGTLSHVQLKP